MKKFVNPIPDGGAPLHNNRITTELQTEFWEVIQGLMSAYDGTTQGVVVKGCVLSNNGGNFDMTAGIVYLNGEYMRVPAATNQAFPKYIAAKTPTFEQKTFNDGIAKNLIEVKEAELVGSIPGSQYIAITSLTSPIRNDVRLFDDTIQFIIDGGGAVITSGMKGDVIVPFDCVIQSVELYSRTSGNIEVDLWVDTYANFPSAVGDSIVSSTPPTLSAQTKYQDTILTGWSKNLTKGTHIGYNVNSASTVTRVTIVLYVKK